MFAERAACFYPHESLCTLIIWQFRVTVVMIQFQLDARNTYCSVEEKNQSFTE